MNEDITVVTPVETVNPVAETVLPDPTVEVADTTPQQFEEVLAKQNQLTPANLQTYYDKLFQDGVLVNLHISAWSMSCKLKEDDLGLEKQPEIGGAHV